MWPKCRGNFKVKYMRRKLGALHGVFRIKASADVERDGIWGGFGHAQHEETFQIFISLGLFTIVLRGNGH